MSDNKPVFIGTMEDYEKEKNQAPSKEAIDAAVEFIESIVDACGPYEYVNGTRIVSDAYVVLRKIRGNT